MVFSLSALFRRDRKASDPFGVQEGEESYKSEEPTGRDIGRWVAYGLSGLMGLLLVGFIATAIMTADQTAGSVAGIIPTEISEVVPQNDGLQENIDTRPNVTVPVLLERGDGKSAGSQTIISGQLENAQALADPTSKADLSGERRPLLLQESTDGAILVEEQFTKDRNVQSSSRSQSMEDLLRQSRESGESLQRTNKTAGTQLQSEEQGLASEPAESELVQNSRVDNVGTDSSIASLIDTTQYADVVDSGQESAETKYSLIRPDSRILPGAPRRLGQDQAAGESSPVGEAPRLSEPELPPTNSRAISASPPRFTALPKAEQLALMPDAAARVAIIVGGLGLNRSASNAAIDTLPAKITLSFSPYADDLQGWLQKAIRFGHEVLVEVPMEGKRFPANDPGPLGLLTSLDQVQNEERLSAILEMATGSAGVLDITGSRFRESAEHINLLFDVLAARGLFYIQGRPGLRQGNDIVPALTADIILDERAFRASIDARLDFIEQLAKYQGSSVGLASAKPVTFERIALWLDEAGQRGVSITPISQIFIQ